MRIDSWISGNIEWDLTVEYAGILNEIWQLNKWEYWMRFDCWISGNIEWDLTVE